MTDTKTNTGTGTRSTARCCTDGAKYVADTSGAYWLLELWRLSVNPDQTATLACEDGNGRAVLTKALAYTDRALFHQWHDPIAERVLMAPIRPAFARSPNHGCCSPDSAQWLFALRPRFFLPCRLHVIIQFITY